MSEFVAALEIPTISNTTYLNVHSDLSNSIHNTAWDEIQKAGAEERELAIQAGDIDADGVPFCTVVADGQWSKRSYKTKYDALSGVVYKYKYNTYIFTITIYYDIFRLL